MAAFGRGAAVVFGRGARILNSKPVARPFVETALQLFFPPPLPTSQQDLVQYANRASKGSSFGYRDAEVINDMKLVGMKELRAVTAFTAKRSVLKEKLMAELAAKRVPKDVIESIVSGVASTREYTQSLEDFSVDGGGMGKIWKATVMLKPDPKDDESSQVAMAVSGAEFDAAKEVAAYEEEEVPVYEEVERFETFTESGLLKDYKVIVPVKTMQLIGYKKKKTPIFKQKTFTTAKLESIKHFLEQKTFGEVRMLYAPAGDGK